MRAAILLVSLLSACTDSTDDGGDGGFFLDLNVTSPVPFSGLLVLQRVDTMSGPGITSPELLASGTPAPTTAMIEHFIGNAGVVAGQLSSEGAIHRWELGSPLTNLDILGLVATFSGSFTPVAYVETLDIDYQSRDGASYATGTVPLAELTGVAEMWSTGTASCVRMVDDSGKTTYLVNDNDSDCDGIPDENDCEPDVFCSPATEGGIATCSGGTGC
jgi:hypothetical protein